MIVKLVIFTLISSVAKSEKLKNEEANGFFFTMPKTLMFGRNETVCMSIHHSALPDKIIIDLKIKDTHFFTTVIPDSEFSCFPMLVPHSNKYKKHLVSVKVEVHFKNVSYAAHNQDAVVINVNRNITLIETDRASYKSEDTVKIRVLSLAEDLRPLANYRIPFVRITNPLGLGVALWENVSTDLGLTHLEHFLTRNSLEGKWTIETEFEKTTFEVNKHVLPRFKIIISHPKIIYYKSQSVSIKVCAKYFYGGLVKGTAFLKLSDSNSHLRSVEDAKTMANGCADFLFTQERLQFSDFSRTETKLLILLTATVTEFGTDHMELKTARSLVVAKPYTMKFKQSNVFLPGLPYSGVLEINNINYDKQGDVVEICYITALKKSWNYLQNEECSNFTLKNERILKFHILPLHHNIIHLQVNARSLNHTNINDNLLVIRLFSPNWNYIQLDHSLSQNEENCKSQQQFWVRYTTNKLRDNDKITFYYMVKSGGHMLKMGKITHTVHIFRVNYTKEYNDYVGNVHKYSALGTGISKFLLKFKLDSYQSSYQIIVYYINKEGELISTIKDVKMSICFSNEVKVNWSHKQVPPGGSASLLVETTSSSLCSVAAIDKASAALDRITGASNIKSLVKAFPVKEDYDIGKKTCISPTPKSKKGNTTQESKRIKRHVYPFSEDYDAYDIINKFGLVTITNFKVITKPCYTGPIYENQNAAQSLTDRYEVVDEDKITSLRTFFPETWLWELAPVRNVAVMHRNLPHTITTWATNVLCVSSKDGIGLSKPIEITTFHPFFVDLIIPNTIKKSETLYLHIIVFNYLTHNIPVKITLNVSSNQILENLSNKTSFSGCISSNDTLTRVLEMKAKKVGSVNVTVAAELDAAFPRTCGPDVLINKKDVVLKTLIVEPEGFLQHLTKSALLCGSDKDTSGNVTWALATPVNAISDTVSGEIVLNGNILGQVFHNLDDFVTMPTGCGEQISAQLAANLYVLKYLNSSRLLSHSTRRRIVQFFKIGYQRLLNYVHNDGSFSAFGYHDPAGSMFLTAFVVRIMQNIKQYIYVDRNVIERAVAWILDHQLENGCFHTMLHVFQDMGGTTTKNSTAALTSFVMISLLESKVTLPESVKTNAKYCIRGQSDLDKYTLAISSFALLKVHWFSEAKRMLDKLFEICNSKENMIWWTDNESGSITTDIEIASYVLLSLLELRNKDTLAQAHSIVRWLSTQQGPKGGFVSTQETAVALDALSRYIRLVYHRNLNLSITVNAENSRHLAAMSSKDLLKTERIPLKNVNNTVEIFALGKGCILAQAVLSYNIKQTFSPQAFQMEIKTFPNVADQCKTANLSSCIRYNKSDAQSNMAILEVGLPSGYEPDKEYLYRMIQDQSANIKMFEEKDNNLVLYLTQVTASQVCVNLTIREKVPVLSRLKSNIRLYDYYRPEFYLTKFYRLNDSCQQERG